MITLWIAAAFLAAAAAALVAHRAASAPSAGSDGAAAVYRRQLSEIDALADRGLIDADERASAHAETGRRLLAAARAPAGAAQRRLSPQMILALASVPAIAALGLYLAVGDPGLPDVPFAARLAEWRAHPDQYGPPEFAALLEKIAADRPSDPEPLMRLATLQVETGDPDAAERTLRRAITVAPRLSDAWAMLGEISALKANGAVDAAAEANFRRALALEPTSATARYYLARARALRGDSAGAIADWQALVAALPAGDPHRAQVEQEIASVQTTGKPTAFQPPAPPQPQITPAVRQMVEGLATRLKTQPNDPQGWVRLVRAYAVMGESAKRDAALAQARSRFAAQPQVLSDLNAAATPPGQ